MSTSSNRRRLARDHAELQKSLPPDFFFPTPLTTTTYHLPPSDDLSTLTLHLLGPTSTPYTSGLFTLTLTIPPTYPSSPPTATFRTKIFHPNVDERTGDVCVDTLKRDWSPDLTLRHVLLTIRCLLIYPNPESSLNETAGKLLREDYKAFEKHAKLITEVHAVIPKALKTLVEEVRARDDDTAKPAVNEEKEEKEEDVSEFGKENEPSLSTTTLPLPTSPTPTLPTTSLGKRIMSESHENLPASTIPEGRKQPKLNSTISSLASSAVANTSTSSLPSTLGPVVGKEEEAEGKQPKGRVEGLKRPVVRRAVSAAEKKTAAVKKGLKRF